MKTRQQDILKTTIADFIYTAEPVGSKTLQSKYKINCSPATIRNELKTLVDEGYLEHVHTSSGRVPTDKGYRYFVDKLSEKQTMPAQEELWFKEQFQHMGSNIQDMLIQLTELMSSVMDYTTIVMLPSIFQESLKAAHLVLVDIDTVLITLMSTLGMNHQAVVNISGDVNQEDLTKIANLLTHKLGGQSFSALDNIDVDYLIKELPSYKGVFEELVLSIGKMNESLKSQKSIYTKGKGNMLRLPEFENISYAREVMECLEETKVLHQLMQRHIDTGTVEAFIGGENGVESLSQCSVLMAPYTVEGKTVGSISVLGPKRMDYARLMALIHRLSGMIEDQMKPQEV
ncbi:heat-inducible transcription repressor HrcA [bacterium]|jgi:heat-inducible transcriptional repressor|nr:heat-inducible transcription repressor HrcA [bacterium]